VAMDSALCIRPLLTAFMLYWQKIGTKRRGRMLFEFCKWMGEECREHTQSDPAPLRPGGFNANIDLCLTTPVLSLIDVQHKTFGNRSLTHEWEIACFVVRDSSKFILTRLASKLVVGNNIVYYRYV
jgi:hypothetical protein